MADPAALSTASLPRSLASRRPLSSPLHGRSRSLRRCRPVRARARKGAGDPEDIYGPYPWPWEQPLDLTTGFDIEWVQEEKITLFTSDGLVQIGGSMVPRRVTPSEGLDMGRRLCIYGFCRSIEMLSDVVEDTVLEHGGEIVTASSDGLQEKLTMSVAVPLLWGVPPASETLHVAVRSGGGIVDKIYWQWDLF